jgi:glyoxylase-like metal-dependent hydrolase (beta-lactamase superfamily II)/8-oxo-dGTP pyrophosphatase MutT (NUDIX family)
VFSHGVVAVSTVSAAGSVLLARAPAAREVFLVRRSERLRFFGGFHAFPGGRVTAADRAAPAGADAWAAQRTAAARELFEETGVLLARRPDGTFPADDEGLAEARRGLLADESAWPAMLGRLGVAVDTADLRHAGSLVTPAFAPVRFDTAFFVADLPPGQRAEVWPGELDAGAWDTADGILRAWTSGQLLLSPPTVSFLEAVRGRPLDVLAVRIAPLLELLAAGDLPPIWFNPGVLMLPLLTEGLPPSTHTNAYLVGTDSPYLLDPGPVADDEQARLFAALDGHLSSGRRLAGVILTHHHPDHVDAAGACARRYGAPVLTHPETARLLSGKVAVSATLDDGAQLPLGVAPDGAGPWHLHAVFTPGHAPGHLAFHEPRYGLLFAGDLVSTLSSVVIAPPEGDLAVYLDSLRRVGELPARLLLPAHGSPVARPAGVIAECLEHRRQREAELLQALGGESRTVPELAVEVYRGLPAPLMRFAEMQIQAGLLKLQAEGRAEAAGNRWRRTTA